MNVMNNYQMDNYATTFVAYSWLLYYLEHLHSNNIQLTQECVEHSVTRKNRQMSIKVAQNYVTTKVIDFNTFTKIA